MLLDNAPVPRSAELTRILALPRRVWTPELALATAEALTPQLLNERGLAVWNTLATMSRDRREAEIARFVLKKELGGENCPIRLNGSQAQVLVETYHLRGFFAAEPVGGGKTLATWLLPHVLEPLGVKRPMLILPASVATEKTEIEFEALRQYWITPRYALQVGHRSVTSYSLIGHPNHAQLLCDCAACVDPAGKLGHVEQRLGYRPDLFMLDEGQRARNKTSAQTRRIMRYKVNHPDTIFVSLSGSPRRHSIKDDAHLMAAALGLNSPAPITYVDLEQWAQALDNKPAGGIRRRPGALTAFIDQNVDEDDCAAPLLERVRGGYMRWVRETPGILVNRKSSCDKPLTIRLLKAPDDPLIEKFFYDFRATGELPDGWDVSDPLSRIAKASEAAQGFYYVGDPRPPQEWRDARKAWNKVVRETIAESERRGVPIDSEKIVALRFPDHPALTRWRELKPLYDPEKHKKPVWISASPLAYAVEWLRHNGPALVWVAHVAIGEALAAMSGLPYYGEKGKDAHGRSIERASANDSAIVSIHANKVGRNLFGWNRALVMSPPISGEDWEQGPLGRMHRGGQPRAVFVDVLISCVENLQAIDKACFEAKFVDSDGEGLMQKLLIANWDWSQLPLRQLQTLDLEDPRRARWTLPDPK